MDTVKAVSIIAALLFAALALFFFMQSSSRGAQLEKAKATNILTIDLLRVQGARCTAAVGDFAATAKCITPLLATKDFKEDSFGQPDPKLGTSGFIVIKNVNTYSYESKNFTFEFNRAKAQEGCTIPGEITQGVTCRFNFYERCEKGDVLEVMYTKDDPSSDEQSDVITSKIFTKTC